MTRIKDNSPKTDSQKNTEAKEPPKKGRGTPRNARGRGKAGKAGNNQPNRRQVNTYSSYRSTLKVWIGELYLEGTQGKINVKFKKPCKIDYFTGARGGWHSEQFLPNVEKQKRRCSGQFPPQQTARTDTVFTSQCAVQSKIAKANTTGKFHGADLSKYRGNFRANLDTRTATKKNARWNGKICNHLFPKSLEFMSHITYVTEVTFIFKSPL